MSDSVKQWIDSDELRRLAETLMEPAPRQAAPPQDVTYGEDFVGYAAVIDDAQINPAQTQAAKMLEAARGAATNSGMLEKEATQEPVEAKKPAPEPRPMTKQVSGSEAGVGKVARPVVPNEEQAPMTRTPAPDVQPQEIEQPAPEKTKIESPFKIVARLGKTAPVSNPAPAETVAESSKPIEVSRPVPPRDGHPVMTAPLPRRLKSFGEWLKQSTGTQSYFICDRNGELLIDEVRNRKLVKAARSLAHASSSASRQSGTNLQPATMQVKIESNAILQVVPLRSHFGLVILGAVVTRPFTEAQLVEILRGLSLVLGQQGN